jgi:hypothetical protein
MLAEQCERGQGGRAVGPHVVRVHPSESVPRELNSAKVAIWAYVRNEKGEVASLDGSQTAPGNIIIAA